MLYGFWTHLYFKNHPIWSAGRSRLGELLQGADAVLWEVLNRGSVVLWLVGAGSMRYQVVTLWSFFGKAQKTGLDAEKPVEFLLDFSVS